MIALARCHGESRENHSNERQLIHVSITLGKISEKSERQGCFEGF